MAAQGKAQDGHQKKQNRKRSPDHLIGAFVRLAFDKLRPRRSVSEVEPHAEVPLAGTHVSPDTASRETKLSYQRL